MTLNSLLGLGYLCEELPPPYGSKLLAAKYPLLKPYLAKLKKSQLPQDTLCLNYVAPKVGIHRRNFSIPHPYPQILLSETIVNNWNNILTEYKKSSFSVSIPEIDITKKRSIVYLNKFELFRELCIKFSSSTQYELHLDISKYFFSIYTHSIPWAVHSKPIAKVNKSHSLWGNQLDTYIRKSQSNQTKGIPVGTDTSRIIGEIIGCSIDKQFKNQMLKNSIVVKGCRFVDDCRYYFESLSDAELGLKEYQKILNEYSLNLNEEKTHILKMPCIFDNTWKTLLNTIHIDEILSKKQRSGLKTYFNHMINLALKYPKDSVIKYGIQRLLKINVHKNNIDLFEPLIFNLTLTEPAILKTVVEILIKYKGLLSKNGISNFFLALINQNLHKGHDFEISWALWIAKLFNIKIPRSLAQEIIDSRDGISIIIMLDLIKLKQVTAGKINYSNLIAELDLKSLENDLWLLAYEAEFHSWLPISNIGGNPFFKELKRQGIHFYDSGTSGGTITRTSKHGVPVVSGSSRKAVSGKLKQLAIKNAVEAY